MKILRAAFLLAAPFISAQGNQNRSNILQQARVSCSPTYNAAFRGCKYSDEVVCKRIAREKATYCARIYVKHMILSRK